MKTSDGRTISWVHNCPFCGPLQPGWLFRQQLLEHLGKVHPQQDRILREARTRNRVALAALEAR